MSNTEKNVSCTASTVSVENSAIWQVPSSKTRPGITNRRSSFPSAARRKPSRITRKGGPLNDVQRSEIQRVQYLGHTYGSYQSYRATLRGCHYCLHLDLPGWHRSQSQSQGRQDTQQWEARHQPCQVRSELHRRHPLQSIQTNQNQCV